LPDTLYVERYGFSADTIKSLRAMGHTVKEGEGQGAAEVIILNSKDNLLEGGVDRRPPDGGAAGK
jgi:gamma-glutamyltranspeptidase